MSRVARWLMDGEEEALAALPAGLKAMLRDVHAVVDSGRYDENEAELIRETIGENIAALQRSQKRYLYQPGFEVSQAFYHRLRSARRTVAVHQLVCPAFAKLVEV